MRFLSVLAPRIEQLLALVLDPVSLVPSSFVEQKKQEMRTWSARAPLISLHQVKAKFLQ
jgi:hypothetical protein